MPDWISIPGLLVAEVSETLELEKMGLIVPFEDVLRAQGDSLADFLAPLSREFCEPPFVRSTPVVLYNLEQLRAAGLDRSLKLNPGR